MTEGRAAVFSSEVGSSALGELLGRYGPGPFSWLHPAAHLLFSDRVTLLSWRSDSFGPLLAGETADGTLFLPLPPPAFLLPDLSPRARGECLAALFSELSESPGRRPPPFLENCPLGSLPSGRFLIEPSESEYLVSAQALCNLSGKGGRSLRWEGNRFRRDHPKVRLRLVVPEDEPEIRHLSTGFVRRRQESARSEIDALLAADLARAFERAPGLGARGMLEGWVLEEPGRLLGLQWYGRSPDGKTLVCFLEARGNGVSNLGSVMTREVLLKAGEGVRFVNLMGSSGIDGVERAKRDRPHDLVLPLFRLRPALPGTRRRS